MLKRKTTSLVLAALLALSAGAAACGATMTTATPATTPAPRWRSSTRRRPAEPKPTTRRRNAGPPVTGGPRVVAAHLGENADENARHGLEPPGPTVWPATRRPPKSCRGWSPRSTTRPRPGLGEWTVIELAAHTMRALTTVEQYVAAGPSGPPQLEDAAAYVAAYLDARRRQPELDAQVAARGRQSVGALGDDPGGEFSATVARVAALLATTDGETTVSTPWGAIRLVDYLRTRVMELVMHGMDLAAALSVDWRPPPEALTDTLHLLSEVAVRTGRRPGPGTDARGTGDRRRRAADHPLSCATRSAPASSLRLLATASTLAGKLAAELASSSHSRRKELGTPETASGVSRVPAL